MLKENYKKNYFITQFKFITTKGQQDCSTVCPFMELVAQPNNQTFSVASIKFTQTPLWPCGPQLRTSVLGYHKRTIQNTSRYRQWC